MTARKTAEPKASAEPAATEPEPQGRYAQHTTSWAAGEGEQDQPHPAGDATSGGHVQGLAGQAVSMQPENGRNFAMISGQGMTPSSRPDVQHPGVDRPVGGGPHGHDFQTSPLDGPPEPASDEIAAASKPSVPRSTSN